MAPTTLLRATGPSVQWRREFGEGVETVPADTAIVKVGESTTSLIRVIRILRLRISPHNGSEQVSRSERFSGFQGNMCTPNRAISRPCFRINRGAHRLRVDDPTEQLRRRSGQLLSNQFDAGKSFPIKQDPLQILACECLNLDLAS